MISSLGHRLIGALIAGSAMAAIAVGTADAAQPARTDAAVVDSPTSATLYGRVEPGNPDSAWFFQYGKTKPYGHTMPLHPIGSGPSGELHQGIAHLKPATTYHYRIVLKQGRYPATYTGGGDLTFTTPSSASAPATTGGASSVSPTVETLHGFVQTKNPDSAWTFQYGTTKSYGHQTPAQRIRSGAYSVEASAEQLKPNAIYHYRLVVKEGNYPATTFYVSADRTFKTAKPVTYGNTSLPSKQLQVQNSVVSIPIECSGSRGAVCTGTLSITHKRGNGTTVSCAATSFHLDATNTKVVRTGVSKACELILVKHQRHHLPAKFHATFSSHQGPLNTTVTLEGT